LALSAADLADLQSRQLFRRNAGPVSRIREY